MSAWIVTKAHIDALVYALGKRELLEQSPDQTGQLLWDENHASVNYDENTVAPTYRYAEPATVWNLADLDFILECFDYQTQEHPSYSSTGTFALVRELRQALERELIHQAFEVKAPWGIPECGGSHPGYLDCDACERMTAHQDA